MTPIEQMDEWADKNWVQDSLPGMEPLCNCRCKNPKGKCGCCDDSLSSWYDEKNV